VSSRYWTLDGPSRQALKGQRAEARDDVVLDVAFVGVDVLDRSWDRFVGSQRSVRYA